MQDHYLKEHTIQETEVHPVDSYIWKDIAQMRPAAVLHMRKDHSGNWMWTISPTGQFSFVSAWNIVRSPAPIFKLHNIV